MVSFFGLKLGSDRKKAQTKVQTKSPQKWERVNQNTMGEGRYFNHNFSRPQLPASTSRPGTSNSTRSISNWRSVFKNPALTSSMVDLAPPGRRRPSVGSLRHAASDMNLRPGTALPTALGGSGLRPGTPSRPASSKKAGWVNPLDVHFCKDPASSRPGTALGPNTAAFAASRAPPTPTSPRNFLGNLDLGPSAGGSEVNAHTATNPSSTFNGRKSDEEVTAQNGYPSPPQSDRNSDRAFSPVNVPNSDNGHSSSKRNAPSGLRKMDVQGPKSLPSPAPSVQRTSEDRSEGPIIRNVPARRETMAFHQPRRGSFALDFEGPQRATLMPSPKEGFTGNFADFDFGETVAKTISNSSAKGEKPSWGEESARPGRDSVSSDSTKESFREMPSNNTPSSYSVFAATQMEREQSKSPAPTQASEDQAANSSLIDQLPKPPRATGRQPTGAPPTAAQSHPGLNNGLKISQQQGFQSRFGSITSSRAAPPRPLRPVTASAAEQTQLSPRSPYGPPTVANNSYMRDDVPPPRPKDVVPLSPFGRPAMKGDFPVSKGLPRGRQPGPLQAHPLPTPTDEDISFSLQIWPDFEQSEPRRSAIPAPLTPARPHTSHAAGPGIATPTSASAPRIPSPTFPSLAKSISSSSSTFGQSFEINFDEPFNSPTLGGFPSLDRQPSTNSEGGSRRMEAKKAPPRPAPVTLPPSSNKGLGSAPVKSPVVSEFAATFI
ncbi:hypothetical protein QQS21_008221 [Conoideocrella luteorostrata]|uniref:Uncharacterized protein n=1 Tax=Conoideocrella luteorostrata TaxID=1105319 RepID=A0AAJ0FRM5_9HYPO|nr:hypothetical protein QQS21_008221 [Conoideocrella luteorostrata]